MGSEVTEHLKIEKAEEEGEENRRRNEGWGGRLSVVLAKKGEVGLCHNLECVGVLKLAGLFSGCSPSHSVLCSIRYWVACVVLR